MRASKTAEFMAIARIAQHFGRPGTPNDQAWIESFFGHLRGEHPYLDTLTDPETLRRELDIRREHYNTIRLHESIGYITPDDEHHGPGPAIRKQRREGLTAARAHRIATRRQLRQTDPEPPSRDEDIQNPNLVSYLRHGSPSSLVTDHDAPTVRQRDAQHPVAAKDGWAADLEELIENLFRWRDTWRDDGHHQIPRFKHAKITREWDTLLQRALLVHPHQPGRPSGQTHARRLAVRLRDRKEDYLRWLSDFTVPATNNTAEQSVPMIRTKTKTSGGFRTLAGLQQFLTIRGYLDTLRKNHRHIITDLRHALQGNPGYQPET